MSTVIKSAILDGPYRYLLTRRWGLGRTVLFVMLNPSIADAERDDPTIRRCIDFGQRWGFSKLEVVNLFAFRATSPAVLRGVVERVGPDNNDHITAAAARAAQIVAAWGASPFAGIGGRDLVVCSLLAPRPLYCLRVNGDGSPAHPLRVPAALMPRVWQGQ